MEMNTFEALLSVDQAGNQLPPQPVSVQEHIQHYLSLSPEEQRDQWLTEEYVSAFPVIARHLLSPEGLATNDVAVRAQFFNAGLEALRIYPLAITKNIPFGPKPPFIAASSLAYDISTDTCLTDRDTHTTATADNLLRIDLAAILMLGFSLPESDRAMRAFIDVYDQRPPGSKNSLNAILSMLLSAKSVARQWIKLNGLDAASGKDWDSEYTTLILNLPAHVIDPSKGRPSLLPRDITMPNAHTEYSPTTIKIFLQYAAQFAEQLTMTSARARDLLDFFANVRNMPKEFLQDDEVQAAVFSIIGAANPAAVKVKPEKLTHAREVLRRYRATRRGFRWYDTDIQQLVG